MDSPREHWRAQCLISLTSFNRMIELVSEKPLTLVKLFAWHSSVLGKELAFRFLEFRDGKV